MNDLDIDKIIKRILALQLMNDRGWKEVDLENEELNITEKRDSEKTFNNLKKWALNENIISYLSKKEYNLYIKEIGTLNKEEYAELTWQIEKLLPLLWAIGIIDELPEFSSQNKEEYYKELFFLKTDPIKQIKFKYIETKNNFPRRKKKIELYNNAYMFYNWRCKELLLGNKTKVNMRIEIPKIFGSNLNDSINLLPLDMNGEILVKAFSLIINELNKTELFIVQRIVEFRQYAFSWLSDTDEEWDDITNDT